jgi:hypothetical protein
MRRMIWLATVFLTGILFALSANAEEPYGTFAQHGRYTYDDQSGYYDWDDTLIIRRDGTAEMTTRHEETLKLGWRLPGCDDSVTAGSLELRQEFTVSVVDEVVSLDRQGPIEILRKEPACWEADQASLADVYRDPWTLQWRNSRLTNKDGEYFRQD